MTTQLTSDLSTKVDNDQRKLQIILAAIIANLDNINKRLTKLEEKS
jgi:hypothetical protein